MDYEFALSYGVDSDSFASLNSYQACHTDECESYTGTFDSYSRIKEPSLGNFMFYVENDNYDVKIKTVGDISLIGYAFDISKKKRRSYIAFIGLYYKESLLKGIHGNQTNNLVETERFNQYPMLYVNPITGKGYTCDCFKGTVSDKELIIDSLPSELEFVKGICDYCNKTTPKYQYGSSYNNLFMQSFEVYHQLLLRKKYNYKEQVNLPISGFDSAEKFNGTLVLPSESDEIKDELEDVLREHFGYPKKGELWISETMLYKIACQIFSKDDVIFHYRGKEMEGLEIDIWVPKFKIGIEYQGVQHFKSVEHWGGEEGLIKRKLNDKKKKALFKKNNYHLVEYMHNEDISEDNLRSKLDSYME